MPKKSPPMTPTSKLVSGSQFYTFVFLEFIYIFSFVTPNTQTLLVCPYMLQSYQISISLYI